jgi:hypothetical protein
MMERVMNQITVKDLSFIEMRDTFWISGVELCRKLEYDDPKGQAAKIWKRHKKNLASFSVVAKMAASDFKNYETRIYDETGARFFITKCHMPLADKITIDMIQAFIMLRDERQEISDYRSHGKILFSNLADQLQNTLLAEPNDEKHKFLYMNVAKNNCQTVTGMTPKQLREKRGSKITRDAFTKEEVVQMAALESFQAKYLESHPMDRKSAYRTTKAISQRFEVFSNDLKCFDL